MAFCHHLYLTNTLKLTSIGAIQSPVQFNSQKHRLPTISYCSKLHWALYSFSWEAPSHIPHLHCLIKLQKMFLRIISNVPYNTESCLLFMKHNILNVKKIFQLRILIFMYKFSRQMLPNIFLNFFNFQIMCMKLVQIACIEYLCIKLNVLNNQ